MVFVYANQIARVCIEDIDGTRMAHMIHSPFNRWFKYHVC